MSESPDATTIFAFHVATSLGINEAKDFILESSPLLVARILESAEKIGNIPGQARTIESRTTLLTDPIQDDAKLGPFITHILEEETRKAVADGGRRMGMCHLIWKNTKRRLSEEHNIEWFTPAEMNPGSCID